MSLSREGKECLVGILVIILLTHGSVNFPLEYPLLKQAQGRHCS